MPRGTITWGGAGAALRRSARQASKPPRWLTLGLFGSVQTSSIGGERDGGRQEGFSHARDVAGASGAVVRGLFPGLVPGSLHSPAAAACGSWDRGHGGGQPATHLSRLGKQG